MGVFSHSSNDEPENEHNCFLSFPMYTNVSFELTHRYEQFIE